MYFFVMEEGRNDDEEDWVLFFAIFNIADIVVELDLMDRSSSSTKSCSRRSKTPVAGTVA